MKSLFSTYFYLAILCITPLMYPDCSSSCSSQSGCYDEQEVCCSLNTHSSLRLRSQGSNTARELVGWQYLINTMPDDAEKNAYGVFTSTFEYQRSFDPCKIADYLFGTTQLKFVGSQVPNRDNKGCLIVADYFGLPTDFVGKITIQPVIDNFIYDTQIYIDLDCVLPGLFFKANGPLVHTRWDLGIRDCSQNLSLPPTAFPVGYMGIAINNPAYDEDIFTYQFCENIEAIPSLSTLRDGLSGQTFGEMGTPWKYGKFPFCKQHLTRLADIDLELGYSLFCSDWGRIALYGLLTAPTGNKPCPNSLFSPVVGNEQHWELGAGILGYINFFDSDCYNLSLYFEGNVSHLFKNHQVRSFDFKANGPLSRYMLLKQIGKMVLVNDSTADLVIEAPPLTPTFSYEQELYAGNLINAINYTTRRATVSVPVRGDFSAKLAFTFGNSTVDVGYNIYGNSREKVCIDCQTPCSIDRRKYALKGTTGTHSLATCPEEVLCGTLNPLKPITLNASASHATLFDGTINPENVDNALVLLADQTGDRIIGTYRNFTAQTGEVTNQIARLSAESCEMFPPVLPDVGSIGLAWENTITPNELVPASSAPAAMSVDPVLVTVNDLDLNSATAPSQITHKFFSYLFYTWQESRFTPFLGMGGEIEWAVDNCSRFGINQWGVVCKGGISF